MYLFCFVIFSWSFFSVSLTKTASKGRTLKSKLIDELRQAVDEYERIYVFSFDNLRAAAFKDIRMEWRDSKIFMGKNKVAQIAFGRTPEEEYKGNLRNISDVSCFIYIWVYVCVSSYACLFAIASRCSGSFSSFFVEDD